MFSPQSIPMEQLNANNNTTFENNQAYRTSSLSDNDDEVMNTNLTNDNIVYEAEDINLNNSSSPSESNISYCGLKINSVLSSVLNICSAAIGAGVLTFPYIISTLGIFNTIFIFILVAGCIYHTLNLLRSFVVDTKYFSYSLMTEKTLGKKWLMVYSFSSFIYYLSVNLNYLSLLYSIFKSSFVAHSSFYGYIFLLVTCSIEIFLCLYTSKASNLNLLSLITMFSFTIIVFVTIYNGINSSVEGDYFANKFSKQNLFNPLENQNTFTRFFSSITAIIKFIYAYSYHCSFPTLIGNLKNVNDSNSKKVHNISFIIISVTYLLVAFFGYIIAENVPTVLFREYEDSNKKDSFTIFIKIILFFFFFSLIPNRYIIIRDGYTSLIGKDKLTYKKDLLITTLGLIFSNGFVFLNEELFVEDGNIEIDIFSIMVYMFGGIFGVIISFLLPVINYAAVNGKRKIKSIIGYIISGGFLFVGVLSFGYSIYEMIPPNKEEEQE